MSALLIPYAALGIAIVLMFFMTPRLNRKKDTEEKSLPSDHTNNSWKPEDPWEKEIRLRGKMADKFKAKKR